MTTHLQISSLELKKKIHSNQIKLAANAKLKIYGTLHCASGKRMRKENRLFFKNEQEAKAAGFRPCGHCMKEAYLLWKVADLKFKIQD
jgi:methylphosphotriester-DNA--protein-cysteine methyltransferase